MNCPKCGKDSTGPRWHSGVAPASQRAMCGWYDAAQNRTEHLHYYCVCGYDWTTQTREQFLKQQAGARLSQGEPK